EFVLPLGYGGQAGAALQQVAGGQVDQHQRQVGAFEQLFQADRRQLVGKLDFHAIETGRAGGQHAVGQGQFGEQHGQVGGDSHRSCSRYIFTSVAGSCSRWPWLPCKRISCAARPVMGVAGSEERRVGNGGGHQSVAV